MNYKRIVSNQKIRFRILHFFDWIPDTIMLRLQYRIKMGGWPNFKHPKRFTEKLQLYKMKYRNPVMTQCVDKYEVRKYVESKGLGHILNELYGVYNSADEIDFSSLPDKFVVKSTTGGGGLNVIVVKDKLKCNFEDIKNKVSDWGQHKQGAINSGREWAYTGMGKTRIIIEKFLEDTLSKGQISQCMNEATINNQELHGLTDYKFFCFDGEPFCVQVDSGRYEQHHQNFYDMQWHSMGVHCTYPEGEGVEKPVEFDEMKRLASQLSKDFPFVRVDLYNVGGKTYFGELTFYPSSGYGKFHPDNFDFILGRNFDIF